MQQILILSGKGGTGKTTIASCFIALSHTLAYADCDVDAPNLHITCHDLPLKQKNPFYGMPKAIIDANICITCGLCRNHCAMDAISEDFIINPMLCEGCGFCATLCPMHAITMQETIIGDTFLYQNDATFSTAALYMGAGNSGLLVSEVKRQLIDHVKGGTPLAIIDGSPGIGCPVIASLANTDLVLIVTEATISGITDMYRIVDTVRKNNIPQCICINKADINPGITRQIIAFCQDNHYPMVGTIPTDHTVSKAINNQINLMHYDCPASSAIRDVFNNTLLCLPERKR